MAVEVGNIVEGMVTGIKKFGAFVQLPDGKTGMVQTSVSAGSLRRLLAVSFAAGGSYTAVVIEKVL